MKILASIHTHSPQEEFCGISGPDMQSLGKYGPVFMMGENNFSARKANIDNTRWGYHQMQLCSIKDLLNKNKPVISLYNSLFPIELGKNDY